jgi:putative transposase
MDFVSDATGDGRKFRILTVVDMCTRECLTLVAARSLPSPSVTRALDGVLAERPAPQVIQVDNGTEFSCNHFDAWAYGRGIRIDYIRPGKPVDNAHIEAFNGRLRDECLDVQWFESLDGARRALAEWRRDYNEARPHSRLGDLAPLAFAARFAGLGPRIEPRTAAGRT